jgi:hypothetical protein
MLQPRDIESVYDKIIQIIPINKNTTKLIEELKDFIDTLWNKAPEVRRSAETFIPFMNILIKNIPNIMELKNDDDKWKFDVRDIFAGNIILLE